jgi:hypothetical protein
MKIEIEWDCSYSASVKIDGKEMRVKLSPGMVKLEGIKGKMLENTLGGIVAQKLMSIVGDAMQAECIACEGHYLDDESNRTWTKMNNTLAKAVESRIW